MPKRITKTKIDEISKEISSGYELMRWLGILQGLFILIAFLVGIVIWDSRLKLFFNLILPITITIPFFLTFLIKPIETDLWRELNE